MNVFQGLKSTTLKFFGFFFMVWEYFYVFQYNLSVKIFQRLCLFKVLLIFPDLRLFSGLQSSTFFVLFTWVSNFFSQAILLVPSIAHKKALEFQIKFIKIYESFIKINLSYKITKALIHTMKIEETFSNYYFIMYLVFRNFKLWPTCYHLQKDDNKLACVTHWKSNFTTAITTEVAMKENW